MNKGIARLILFASLVVLLVSGFASQAFGQAETGTINGTVTDASNAVVPNAKVTIKNLGTALERSVATDSRGFYSVSNLPPGNYSVVVEATNLAKKEIRTEVTVGVRQEINFTLAVGVSSTVIEVLGEGGVNVNTETATIGTVIDSKQIQELPTLNRNPYTFAAYVGTASDGDPSGRGVGVSFNGLRSAGTNILLDGAANNDEFTASVGQSIPLDSVQEYSVLTNNFTAEYGRASSGVVNLATKSGTNDYHGSAYEYNRVSAMSSASFYDNANGIEKGNFTRNQFGGSLGGPVKKDKMFFFGNIEWNRIRSTASQTAYIIDPSFIETYSQPAMVDFYNQLGTTRQGLTYLHNQDVPFTQDGFCGGSGSAVNRTNAYNTLMGYYTCAGVPDGVPFMDKVSYRVSSDAGAGSPQNQILGVGRFDWNLSDKTSLYARYAVNQFNLFTGTINNSAYTGTGSPSDFGYDSGENDLQNNIMVSVTHSFSTTTTMQNKVVYNRLTQVQPLGTAPITPTLYFNPSVATTVNGVDLQMPGYNATTPGNSIPFGGPQNFIQFYQDWSKVMGRHTLRFGGSYDYQQDNRSFGAYEEPVGAFATSGSFGTAAMNRFLGGYWGYYNGAVNPQGNFPCQYVITAGQPCGVPQGTPDPSGDIQLPVSQPNFSRSNRYQEFALYVADSYRATRNLTLSLGLRYEFFGTQHNNNQQLDSNYYLGTGGDLYQNITNGSVMIAPDSPIGKLWEPSWKNFAPKIGFAYDVEGNGKTVIRGGYSIAYERNFGNVTFNVIQNPPAQAIVALTDGGNVVQGSMPVTTNWAGPLSGDSGTQAIPNVSLRAVDPHIHQAYAQLYSLTLERELKHNLILGIDYSGSKGTHLYDIANINRYGSGAYYEGDASSLARLRTTQYSNINWRGSNAYSNYNALVVRVQANNFQKTGLTLNANYTYGHTLDVLSDTFSSSGNQYNLGYLDAFVPQVDYGNSYMDIRNRFTASAVWEVPFAKNTHGWVKQVADGWTVSPLVLIETGTPFSVYDCTNAFTVCMYAVNANGGLKKGAPQNLQLAGPDNYIYTPFYTNATPSDPYAGLPLFDSSYVNETTGMSDYGPWPTAMNGRNNFRGPGYWNVDLGVYKTFFIGERYHLQFRGEFYNVFNHANLFVYGGDAEVEYPYLDAYKNGLRTVQLALRLTF